jgi:two-component system, cell cycle response regulator
MAADKILIIDDEEANLDLMRNYIDSFGFDCDTASGGNKAVEKLQSGSFTIVLTDMVMPGMDGMEVLQHIREHHPKIGVIVITGYGQAFSYTSVIKAGASDFITKPFNPDELEAKLRRLIRELHLVRRLEHHSIYDALTGLHNRRYFESKLLSEAQRADRQRYTLFLQMIDVDNLKGHNDENGHLGGDQLLQTVGTILQQSIRENVDWAFRYGGDEFAIIFVQMELVQVAMVAERIGEKYNQQNFSGTGLSMGIARFVRHPGKLWQDDLADLVARADKALYTAKNQGKNQILCDEVQQPSLPLEDRAGR